MHLITARNIEHINNICVFREGNGNEQLNLALKFSGNAWTSL